MKIIVNVIVSILILAVGVVGLIVFGQKPEVPTEDPDLKC